MNFFRFLQPICAQHTQYSTFDQNFNLKRNPKKKNSYERLAYESVDERAYLRLCHEKR